MSSSHPIPAPCQWFSRLAAALDRRSAPRLALLFLGGVLYTLGATVLALRRPDPVPGVFGYHEVWHSMTICAGACHYAVIMMVVTSVTGH